MALLLLVLWSFFFKISSATKKTGFSTVVVVVRAECQHVTSHQKEEEKMHAGNSARGWVPIRSQQQHETDGRHTEGMLERTLCSSLWMDARTEHTSGNFLRTRTTIIGYEKVDGTVSTVAL
jgi:hypothetical protein